MNFSNLLITAINALTKNKLRSPLTSIGVIIGVSSVIIMIGIGSSAQIAIKDKVSKYGANAVSIQSHIKTFSTNDIEAIKNIFPNVSGSPFKAYVNGLGWQPRIDFTLARNFKNSLP